MIRLDNVHATATDPGVRATASRMLRFRKKGYQFTDAFKSGRWDGYIRMVNSHGQFPAGVLPLVRERIPDLEVEDVRVVPTPCDALTPLQLKDVTLMHHQEQAVESAHAAGRGVIEHAVAAGKSIVMVALVQRCAVPALIMVHTKELLYQMIDNLQKHLDAPGLVGVIGDGRWEPNWITVATYQSIAASFKNHRAQAKAFMDSRQFVGVDEVHHIQAATYEDVMQRATNAYYRFGVSATPFKSHNRGDEKDIETYYKVIGAMGPVVSTFDSTEGVEVGRLVPADIFVIDHGGSKNDLPWPQAYEFGIVDSQTRNGAIAQLAALSPKPVLILVERIEHGERLKRFMESVYHLETEFISGGDKTKDRQAALSTLRSEGYDVLVSSVILDEGVDIPNIRTLILAAGGKAQHRIVQRIGRGMRASEGKHHLTVFDLLDRGKYLGAHCEKRLKLYHREPAYQVYQLTLKQAVEALSA